LAVGRGVQSAARRRAEDKCCAERRQASHSGRSPSLQRALLIGDRVIVLAKENGPVTVMKSDATITTRNDEIAVAVKDKIYENVQVASETTQSMTFLPASTSARREFSLSRISISSGHGTSERLYLLWGASRSSSLSRLAYAVRDVVRAMNRLRSVFLSRGVAVSDGVYSPRGRMRWLAKLTVPHRRLAEWLGRQLDQLVLLREEAEKWLLEEAKTHPIIRRLATAPGMGPIRTAQVVAITANPHRFRTRRQYWSYCGFGIVTRSGRWERSQVLQTRGLTRKRHPLHKDYERMLAAGIKPNLAKLTLARKIAATVLSMWKHGEVYDPRRNRAVSDKA